MEFGLSSDQIALSDSVERYLSDACSLDSLRSVTSSGNTAALWPGLAELGIAGLLVSDADGGSGLKLLDVALVAESLGKFAAPGPFIGSVVIAPLALRMAGAAVEQKYLHEVISGRVTVGLACSELAGARGDAGVEADAGLLNGKALFVFDPDADLLFVATSERALYLVEASASGLERIVQTTIDRTRTSGELRFANTPATLISREACDIERLLDCARVMLAADTLGAAQHMLDAAVAYAKQRSQFGRIIGSFQAVKHLCAEMAAELEPSRALLWYAAHALDAVPDDAHLAACQAKAHIAEVGTRIAKTATEVHGGIGFTDLLGLHYWFKRIGFNRQALGAPELLREEAARAQGF